MNDTTRPGRGTSSFLSSEEMKEVLERLRKAGEEEEGVAEEEAEMAEYELGREIGIEWAKRNARPRELQALAELLSEHWFSWHLAEGHSLTAFLLDRHDLEELGYRFVDGEMDIASSPLVDGIIHGALAVWHEVAFKLKRRLRPAQTAS